MAKEIELQVVLNANGVKCVRIIGPSEQHVKGNEMYLKIIDLVKNFDEAIRRRLNEGKGEYKVANGNTH